MRINDEAIIKNHVSDIRQSLINNILINIKEENDTANVNESIELIKTVNNLTDDFIIAQALDDIAHNENIIEYMLSYIMNEKMNEDDLPW